MPNVAEIRAMRGTRYSLDCESNSVSNEASTRKREDRHTRNLTPLSLRGDAKTKSGRPGKKCGNSYIAATATCSVGKGKVNKKALAAGVLAAGAVAAGIYGVSRRRRGGIGGSSSPSSPSPRIPGGPSPKGLSGAPTPKRITGSQIKGLLKAAPKRLSKTQRMRANTKAAAIRAEKSIANAYKQEIKRAGAVGNAMANAGEASGMQAKLSARNLRIRAEAARRRFEPGYRKGKKPPAQLPSSNALKLPFKTKKRFKEYETRDSVWADGFADELQLY